VTNDNREKNNTVKTSVPVTGGAPPAGTVNRKGFSEKATANKKGIAPKGTVSQQNLPFEETAIKTGKKNKHR